MKKIRLGDVITLITGALIIGALVGFVIWQWPRISHLFSQPEEIRTYIASFGIWAPMIFVLLYVFQIIVAPVPGTLMNFAGGLLFGWWKGVLLSWVSCIIGAAIAISVMRAFGRSLMRMFTPEEKLAKFDTYVRSRGWVYLFLLYAVPNPLGDAVNYMSALSDIRLHRLLILVALGRLPSVMISSWFGMISVNFKLVHWILLGVFFVGFLVGVYIVHKPLERLAMRISERLFPPKKR